MTVETADTHLLKLTAEIAVAWLTNPATHIRADNVAVVIAQIHGSLANLQGAAAGGGGAATASPDVQQTPAVSVRRSLASRDHIISMIDGKPYKMLRRHLATHGLTPEQYRARYGLKPDYPMVSESYSETRRKLAKDIGLGRKRDGEPALAPSAANDRAARGPRTEATAAS